MGGVSHPALLTLPSSLPCPPWDGSLFLPAPFSSRWESREPLLCLPVCLPGVPGSMECAWSPEGGAGRGTGGGLRKLPPFEVSRTFRSASPKETSGGPDDKGRKGHGAKSWRATRSARPTRSQPPSYEAGKRGSPPCQPLRAQCPPGLHPGAMPPARWHVASHLASQPCPKGLSLKETPDILSTALSRGLRSNCCSSGLLITDPSGPHPVAGCLTQLIQPWCPHQLKWGRRGGPVEQTRTL